MLDIAIVSHKPVMLNFKRITMMMCYVDFANIRLMHIRTELLRNHKSGFGKPKLGVIIEEWVNLEDEPQH